MIRKSTALVGALCLLGSVSCTTWSPHPLVDTAPEAAIREPDTAANAPAPAPALEGNLPVATTRARTETDAWFDALALRVAADESYTGYRSGDWDFRLTGSGSNNEGWNRGSAALDLGLGYLLTDTLEVAVRQSMAMDNPQGSGTGWSGATRIAFDLYLPMDSVYPFVGANFGGVYGDGVSDSLIAAPEAGVKWFVQADAYLLAMAEYQFLFDHLGQVHDAWNDGEFVYSVGLGLRF